MAFAISSRAGPVVGEREGFVGGERDYQEAVVSSALWAAAGDALGWTTELTDERGLAYRTGRTTLEGPVAWRRKLGRFGPTVPLDAGTYSDDTQLRLAVCRAIRGSGEFDVEAFAKVELPVWPSYSLGGGRGTTSAALNLSRNSVSWFSNFFGGGRQTSYFGAGGNGAAMRVQPHVWKNGPAGGENYVLDVLRDAVVSHGHPKGFCGALFHAACLQHAFRTARTPAPIDWRRFVDQLRDVPDMIAADSQLRMFWLPAWEDATGTKLAVAIARECDVMLSMIGSIEHLQGEAAALYEGTLGATGGLEETTRGTGTNSALTAAALAWAYQDQPITTALLAAANVLGSDTDTIASMAAALMGATKPQPLTWPLQDRDYIEGQARRLAAIAFGQSASTFTYPDLMAWEPPSNQIDVVCSNGGRLLVSGLGIALPQGDTWHAGTTEWQWLKLEFGQTILAKRREQLRQAKASELKAVVDLGTQTSVPTLFDRTDSSPKSSDTARSRVVSGGEESPTASALQLPPNKSNPAVDIDALSEGVIRSDFNPEVIGRAFLQSLDADAPIDRAIGLAAIIAKAIIARRRRSGQR